MCVLWNHDVVSCVSRVNKKGRRKGKKRGKLSKKKMGSKKRFVDADPRKAAAHMPATPMLTGTAAPQTRAATRDENHTDDSRSDEPEVRVHAPSCRMLAWIMDPGGQ